MTVEPKSPTSSDMTPPECEHCGGPSTGRYCCDDCRLADKTGTGHGAPLLWVTDG